MAWILRVQPARVFILIKIIVYRLIKTAHFYQRLHDISALWAVIVVLIRQG